MERDPYVIDDSREGHGNGDDRPKMASRKLEFLSSEITPGNRSHNCRKVKGDVFINENACMSYVWPRIPIMKLAPKGILVYLAPIDRDHRRRSEQNLILYILHCPVTGAPG